MSDLISKKDTLAKMQAFIDRVPKGAYWLSSRGFLTGMMIVEHMPSAERTKGEWILHGEPPWKVRECSECGEKWHHWTGDALPNFCGNCGAEMEVTDE